MNLVFVYGTLRPSLRRVHDCWPHMPTGELIGEALIKGDLYSIYGAVPGVLTSGEGKVIGEIVGVTDDELADFDALEGHPHNWRRVKTVATTSDGTTHPVWVYEYPHVDKGKHTLIPSGDWTETYLSAITE